MSESKPGVLDCINQPMRENHARDFSPPTLALGMRPIEFAVTASSICATSKA